MTIIYFVRHAESDSSVHDPILRPLTEKGLRDRALVTNFLLDKNIDCAFSSPYKRSIDTIADFADRKGIEIKVIRDFREHETISDSYTDEHYFPFIQKYWENRFYKVPGDESIHELQNRNISALEKTIKAYKDKNIIIGTHGMALSSIINYYDKTYEYQNFLAMVKLKPWIVKMTFDGSVNTGIEYFNLFAS
ncbi:MAG: histidine phosphatase family protein [Hydrogeniiclostridium sp.]